MNDEKYITIKELAELKGVSTRAIRLSRGKYITREITVKGGKSFEILLSSIEPELQEKYYSKFIPILSEKQLPAPIDFHKQDKAKTIALARLDLLNLWKNQRKKQQNKTQFDTDFLSAYNAQVLYPGIYAKLGKVSIGTLQRWKRILGNSNNYELLIPNYHYEDYSRTCLTECEKQIFLKLLLHPNKFSIGKAISLTQYVLKTQGAEYIPTSPTFRRFANWYKANYFDKWTLLREGEKALKEDVILHIKRDISKIEVGEVLVADGKRSNFQVINPFIGKPCRATLIGFLDWKSTALVGYEIMLEENTQNIASALRNAILNLGRIPKFVYLDNGKAFRGKYFLGSSNFDEIGLIYGNAGLGKIKTALYLSLQYDAIYVRATNSMSPKWLLEEIAKELDEIPRFYTADIFRQCVNALITNPQMIIVDKIDYLLTDFRTIETLRDLHDETGVPIVLVGMQLAKHKLKKHTHLFDRISEIYNFTEFEYVDIKQIVEEISEVEITKDAIHLIYNKAKSFRQIVNNIDILEKVAQANGLTQIDENIAKEVLNG